MAVFKVKIGKLEIIVDSLDDLDRLIERYGLVEGSEAAVSVPVHEVMQSKRPQKNSDLSLLQRFVENGIAGIPSGELFLTFGVKGKGITGALSDWAERVGLKGDIEKIFKRKIYRGKRVQCLTPQAIATGRHILESS